MSYRITFTRNETKNNLHPIREFNNIVQYRPELIQIPATTSNKVMAHLESLSTINMDARFELT